MLDFGRYEVLSFDCFGTLVDWETGIIDAVRQVLESYGFDLDDESILSLYADFEREAQQGEYNDYRTVLRNVMKRIADSIGFTPLESDLTCLEETLSYWPVFPDSVEALESMKSQYKLAIISNVDDDLFADTAQNLSVDLDYVISSQQARSYKPSIHNFILAIDKIGVDATKILHVAQSLFHDVTPAKSIGLSVVWTNRVSKGKLGSETQPSRITADLEVPDLATLVSLMELK